MLEFLRRLERDVLPKLTATPSAWRSLYVDYEHPYVSRLWTPYEENGVQYRIFLHKIHKSIPSLCLFHPHPWASAVKIIGGSYLMHCGFGKGMVEPPISHTLLLTKGCEYEMVHPDAWHSVCPIDGPVHSVMITSEPWERASHKPTKQLHSLPVDEANGLLGYFSIHYRKS